MSRPDPLVLLSVIALIMLAPSALAEDGYLIRDGKGRRSETVEKSGERWIRYDASGHRIGTIEDGIGKRMIIKDGKGRRVGTVNKGIGERQYIRDNKHRTTHSIEKGHGDELVIRDATGARVGTVEGR